jgi:hypothetical protein
MDDPSDGTYFGKTLRKALRSMVLSSSPVAVFSRPTTLCERPRRNTRESSKQNSLKGKTHIAFARSTGFFLARELTEDDWKIFPCRGLVVCLVTPELFGLGIYESIHGVNHDRGYPFGRRMRKHVMEYRPDICERFSGVRSRGDDKILAGRA